MENGVKFDQEKPRWDLLHLKQLEGAVRVLGMGASKYTRVVVDGDAQECMAFFKKEIEQCCRVSSVECSLHDIVITDIVEIAMKRIYVNAIQPTLNASVRTAKNGVRGTNYALANISETDFWTLQSLCGRSDKNGSALLTETMGSLKKKRKVYFSGSLIAQYAGSPSLDEIVILTMTIKRARLEESYVMVATEGWECLEILRMVLGEQFNICKNVQLKQSCNNLQVVVNGSDNWLQVPDGKRRYYAALMRHLAAWQRGEAADPESGENHLDHAICCLLFLRHFDDVK